MQTSYNILKNGPIDPLEIENLRQAVGWDRSEGIYGKILSLYYAYYTVRSMKNDLIGYVSIITDGIENAFLVNLMVHPKHQSTGIGIDLVRKVFGDLHSAGIRCVQVTFEDHLESFYKKCGFYIFKGGIIDFKYMQWDFNK